MGNKSLVIILLLSHFFKGKDMLSQLSTKDFIIRQFTTDGGLPSNSIYSCAKDPFGYLWFATENGMSRFDGKHFKNYDVTHGLLDNMNIGANIIDNYMLCYGFKGITVIRFIHKDKYEYKHVLLPNIHARLIGQFNDKIYYTILDTTIIHNYKKNSNEKILVLDTLSLIKSFAGSYHLYKKFYPNLFTRLNFGIKSLVIKVDITGNSNNRKMYLYEDSLILDSLSFYGEIGAFNQTYSILSIIVKNSILMYKVKSNKFNLIQSINISDYNTNSCMTIDENTFVLNTIDKGFFLFRRRIGLDSLAKNKYQDFSDWLAKHKQKRGVKCYEILDNETILIGNSGGVAIFDSENCKFGKNFFDTRTYSLHALDSEILYIGTINGLYVYNQISKQSRKLNLREASDSKINSITNDQLGNLWVSAAGKGIYVLDKQYKIVKFYSKEQGLITNDIYKIKIDKKNRKWFSSNQGLQILAENQFYRVDKKEGLISDEVLDFELHGDTAWISTPLGKQSYVYQKPIAKIDIPLYFNSYSINNVAVDSMPSKLNPDEDKIEFNYIGIYYPSPDNIDYEYKLIKDGKETPWQKTRETKLIFEKLQWGEYELLIKAFHNNYPNVYSKVLSKKFYIKPYFYQTIWFYTLIASLVFGTIFYFFYRRNKRKLKALMYERELGKLKLEALKAEMNPHFIFNVLNTIKEAMMEGDFETSQNLLDRLAKVIRQALYNSKRDFLTLEEEINFIDQYIELERERFNKRFEFIKKINNNILQYEVPTMLLQPFIENAIRHGKIGQLTYQGKLYFEVSETDKDLIIVIRDNGLGLEKAKQNKEAHHSEHKSMALEIIQERIALFKRTHSIRIKLEIGATKIDGYNTEVKLCIEKEKN